MVKMKEIAERCNVSIATVSKALHGSSEVGKEKAAWINEVANEMGYVPNANARALKTNRSYNIGVIFEDKSNSGLGHEYFSTMLNAVKEESARLGYDITFNSNKIGVQQSSYLEHARYRNCDGVVIASASFDDPQIIELVQSDMPTVTIDHVFNNRTAILSDNVNGLEAIVDYLVKCNHKKIAFIHGEITAVTNKRLASFYAACEKRGIKVPESYIKEAMYHVPKYSGQATRELLALKNPPTCIIYPDDYSYLGGLSQIEKQGLKVPEDISVVGYDGIYMSRILRPILTTYVQNSVEIGKLAAINLIKMIEKPKTFIAKQISVKGHLQIGETVKEITDR